MNIPKERIRNFSIIAHIDHGKSTLADRLLECTEALASRDMKEQFLDKLDLERERGITIKAQTVRLNYKSKLDGQVYQLNLIDTPGHVDFHYEVSRSLEACEGALLVVDASQGVEAQTVANVYAAIEADLEILPVLNKVDLVTAQPERVKQEISEVIGIDASNASEISAKTGLNVPVLLERIVHDLPPPTIGDVAAPLRALIYDSWFDSYLGAVVQVRIIDGGMRPGQKIKFMQTRRSYEIYQLGVFTPMAQGVESLSSGEVGYFSASIKNLRDVKIGDTVILHDDSTSVPLPGFKEIKPSVFGGLFPVETEDYEELRASLEKLSLNDASFTYEPENSVALGFGFRCGYLGLLHTEIIQERLEREFNLNLITTAPTVVYRVTKEDGEVIFVENPTKLPPTQEIQSIEEPIVTVNVHTPREFIGVILKLCEEKRGIQKGMLMQGVDRALITYELPLNEVVLDFHDRLKSGTKGYASFDYEPAGYRRENLVRLDLRLNGEVVDALSTIVHHQQAYSKGCGLAEKLKDLIDRQMFDIAIQATVGSKVIARSTVKALRKNVTAKCYGGDITRKRKLIEKQKQGKKRMKQVGNVSLSQDAFLAILKS